MKSASHAETITARHRVARADDAVKRCCEVLAGVLIAAALLTAIGFLLAHTILQGVGLSSDAIEDLRQTLVPGIRADVKPEPLERWLFVILTLASPLCILAGLGIARGLSKLVRAGKTPSHHFLAGGISLLAAGISIYQFHGTSLFLYFVFPASPLLDQAILYAAAALVVMIAWRRGFRWLGADCRSRRAWLICVTALAFTIALLPRGLGIRSMLPAKEMTAFAWETHFQAVAYSLTQLYAGKPLLTASPPLYGYYAEFLLPLFKITGLSVFKFCVTMGVLQGLALAGILVVAVKYLRMRATRFLCCVAFLYFTGSTCLVGGRPFDPVFQYWPVRFIFPALSVLVYLRVAHRATWHAWAGLGIFAGLALMWNLESGIAVAGSTLGTLCMEAISTGLARERRNRITMPSPLLALAAMLATCAAFWLLLQMQAHWHRPLHQTSDYQRLFYQSGLMMEPMPLSPHPWWLVVTIYLLALGFGIRGMLSGNRGDFTRLSFFLGVLGTGLFAYYQGRSVDFNLMNASWPAILLAFLFADRLLRAIRAGLLPSVFCWLALPVIYLGTMAATMLPGAMGNVWNFGAPQWKKSVAAQPGTDAMEQRIAFIRSHVGGDPDCVILADYQAVYFMETGLRSSIDAPGLTEIFFVQDLEKLRSSLAQNPARHFFVDGPTLDTLQLTGFVKERYKTLATSRDGKLIYMEPRDH